MTVRICYLNRWRAGTILTQSSQHPQFPSTNTQLDSKKYFWRSRHGIGSGNGLFVVDANNKYIDFDELGNGVVEGTLTEGNYTALSLIEHIAALMTTRSAAVGKSQTYQGTFSEATGKATIEETSGPNNFSILWESGTHGSSNGENSIGTTIGFDTSTDDTGESSYTGDYVRVHYPKAYIDIDLGAAYEIDFIALLNHNIETGSTLKITGATDSGITAGLVHETITWNADDLYHFFSSAQTKQYWRIHIEDIDNADGYIQIGTIFLGKYFEPSRHYTNFFRRGKRDPSGIQASDASVVYSSDKDELEWGSFPFEGLTSASKTEIDAMLAECKRNKAFVIVHDPTSPNSDSFLMRMEELSDPESPHYLKYNWELTCIEVV